MFVEIADSVLEALIDHALATETPCVPWQEGKAALAPPTTTVLLTERRRLVRWLNRKSKLLGRPAARAIAARMAQCKPGQRCLSGACPECSSGLQRALVEANHAYRRELVSNGIKSVVVTIVAKGSRFNLSSSDQVPGTEKRLQATGVILDRLRTAVGKTKIALVGAIDLTLNVDTRRKWELQGEKSFATHWRPHLQFHLTEKQWKRLEQDMRIAFPTKGQIAKPVVASPLDLNPSADAYLLKRLWEPDCRNRRETYLQTPDGELFPRLNTRLEGLRVEERLDQLINLDELGLSRRLVLIGCRLKMTTKGPRIRPIK